MTTYSHEPFQLGILASGNGSNFSAIAKAIESNELHARICCVVYNKANAAVAHRAQEQHIPAIFVASSKEQSRADYDQDVVQILQSYGVELVIMAGWMRIATHILLDAFPERILNIHPSLLPSFPGLHAVEQALDYGVKISGCTVHLVNHELDGGPIIAQSAVPVLDDDTPASLHARIQAEEHRLYPEAISQMIARLQNT